MKKSNIYIENIIKLIENFKLKDLRPIKHIINNDKIQTILICTYISAVSILGIVMVTLDIIKYKIWVFIFPIITTICILSLFSFVLILSKIIKQILITYLKLFLWKPDINNIIKTITLRQVIVSIIIIIIILFFYEYIIKYIIMPLIYVFVMLYSVLNFILGNRYQ